MSVRLSDKDAALVQDLGAALERRLRLAPDGKRYVEAYARWRIGNAHRPRSEWTARPSCPYNITLGTHLRTETDRDLKLALLGEGRELPPAQVGGWGGGA